MSDKLAWAIQSPTDECVECSFNAGFVGQTAEDIAAANDGCEIGERENQAYFVTSLATDGDVMQFGQIVGNPPPPIRW